MNATEALQLIRTYYNSGATRSCSFRKLQLKKLKQALLQHEQEIYDALYADLKKSKEEAYFSELGLILAEISYMLKNLRKWMKAETVSVSVVNFPSGSTVYRDPLGVVLIIAPWNYPLQLVMLGVAGAIAAGNCIVIKPSEMAPHTSVLIEKIISSVFPPEYISVVQGEGAQVIPELMNVFRFDHVFFTGSIPVGKAIYELAAKKLIPVTLELGGKSPAIVEADAPIAVAAKRLVFGKFTNTGQTCIAPDYILVHASVKERLVEEMKKAIQAFYSDSALSYDYGKIINEKRFDVLVSYLQQGNILFGGAHNKANLFIEPTLMDNVSLDASLMNEEIFGPVLPLITFNSMEEALAVIERNPNPLAFYLFTGSRQKEKAWINTVHFGGGCINNTLAHFASHSMPFGGVGNSGMGNYHGKYSFDAFSRLKSVLKTPVWIDPAVKYPPFKGRLKLFKMVIR
ncbi:aldehyde dehydrogenase [Agriterribacter sp.]|uniref:aldehyde dehydrogenase n=1 Tax=Agriterribacter sp. TaxID=2821509 RepID=UPI002CC83F27|nr:aldehyde dehydrogenase [Agriterribacter sp.]HRO44858.1 aldehyde dehydrogenase [Agriterribacter sp.]HRQ18563.1 aldehyde dehydrogenase [Agriterribacter sp.]